MDFLSAQIPHAYISCKSLGEKNNVIRTKLIYYIECYGISDVSSCLLSVVKEDALRLGNDIAYVYNMIFLNFSSFFSSFRI